MQYSCKLQVKLHYIIRFEFDIRFKFDNLLEFVFDLNLEVFVHIRFELKKSHSHTPTVSIILYHDINRIKYQFK